MGPIQKTSQKPVPDHQRAEKSDNATFSGNLIHSGISKQHSNKSIDMSRAKLPQRFDWVMHNIRKVKTEEILEDDDDELQHAADEEISKLEAADHLELLNLSEQLAQVERELAHQQSENNNLDQILAEQEKDWKVLEGINFQALQVSLDIRRQEDEEFLAGLAAGYEAVDRKVEEIEAMLMEIPFMRDYITTMRQYEETKAALESLTKKASSDEQEEDDYSTSWSKRRRFDEKLVEGGDAAGESEETVDESPATTGATADVISSQAADDNPGHSSTGSSRLPNDSTQILSPVDVGCQSDDDLGARSVTSLDYQAIGEKELRELSENPDLLSGFERDFDDDDDSLPASVPSIQIEQRQKHPVAAAGETVTKDSGTEAAAAKAAADDGGPDSSVFKRPATPLDVCRRPTGGRPRFDQPLPYRRNFSRDEDGGLGNDQTSDMIASTISIAKGPPNTSEVNITAASANPSEASIHHESTVHNSRPDSEKLQEVSGPKSVTFRTGQVSPSTLSSIRAADPPSFNRPSPSSDGWDSTVLSLRQNKERSEPVAASSKTRSPLANEQNLPPAQPPRTPDNRKHVNHPAAAANRSTPSTPDQKVHRSSMESAFDWKSKLNASPFLRSRDQPKVVEMPQSPMFTTPQRIVTNPETPLSAYLPCDESPLFSSSLSVPPPTSKEAASPVALGPDSSYGWMREDPIGTGSSYDFVFADRDEDDAEDEDDVSAAYFQS